jgi:hypothetical protein
MKAKGLAVSGKHRISFGNELLSHNKKIGEAIWYLLFCFDKTTKEYLDDETGQCRGRVLGTMPLGDSDIAGPLHRSRHTVRRWREHLTKIGYIRTKRTPIGYIVEVVNSRKGLLKSDVAQIEHRSASDVTPMQHPSKSEVANSRSEVANSHIRCAEVLHPIRENREETEREQTSTTTAVGGDASLSVSVSEKPSGKNRIMATLQKAAVKITGEPFKAANGDKADSADFEKRFGLETLITAWKVWLSDDQNLTMPDGSTRLYLFKTFSDSGHAEILCENFKQYVELGFKNYETIQLLSHFELHKEAVELPPEYVQQIDDQFKSNFKDYADFIYKHRGASLKDYAIAQAARAA